MKKEINCRDCCEIPKENNDILWQFMKQNNNFSIFKIGQSIRDEDPLLTYDYTRNQWFAGRYIGNITFKCNNKEYNLNINPRFGNITLMKMFEEIFNIKFTNSLETYRTSNANNFNVKILIAFIWLQKFSKADRHGLPITKEFKQVKDYTAKGKIDIRKTIFENIKSRKIVSQRKETQFDSVVLRIIYQAYNILLKNYGLDKLNVLRISESTLNTIKSNCLNKLSVTEKEYLSIRYTPIYQSYSDIVDFSWQLIKSDSGYEGNDGSNKISGFFIDMAEIWECYIRSILKEKLFGLGWKTENNIFSIYDNSILKRRIIPDFVFKKDKMYCVFDAKYKNMKYRGIDIDRSDFFQIHSYISFLKTKGIVVSSGLIYPIEADNENHFDQNEIVPLFGLDNSETSFFVGGPQLNEEVIDCNEFFRNIKDTVSKY